MGDNCSHLNPVFLFSFFLHFFYIIEVFIAIFKFLVFQFLILNCFRISDLVIRNIKDFDVIFSQFYTYQFHIV